MKTRRVVCADVSKQLEKGRMNGVMPKGDNEAARKAFRRKKRIREIVQIGAVKLPNTVRAAH